MNSFVRLAGDVPSIQKSFFRNLVAMLFAFILLLRDREGWKVDRGSWPWLLLRAVFGTVGILCNFYAVDHLVLADASMLNKMSPFFAIIFSWILLKERLSPVQALAVVVAFIGSLFIIRPTFSNMDLGASLIGLLGGFGAGVAYTIVRILSKRHVHNAMIVFVFSAFSCLVTLPYVLIVHAPMSAYQLICLLLAGLAAAGGQFSITAAYSFAPARELSVYDYSQVIFSAILGYFLFSQIPDGYSIIGYVLICGTAVFMYFYNSRKHPVSS